MRDYLLYTSAGKYSCLKRWINNHRKFDLWVTNYTDTPSLWEQYADFYNESKGAKFPNFKAVYEQHKDQLIRYKAIMIADDDIIISTQSLNSLFDLITSENLTILTPAFSRFGKISHPTTERQLRSQYRITNFAEVTCPIFNTNSLIEFMDIYRPELSECYGVDWWYLNFLNRKHDTKIAISDNFYCINPYEFTKGTTTREIDSHYSETKRLQLWEAMKQELKIDTFDKRTYAEKENKWLTIIRMAPLFFIEVLFNKTYSQLRGNNFLRRLKTLYVKLKVRKNT